jgi:hypothetical protein
MLRLHAARFAVIQTVLAAVVAALYVAGLAQRPFSGVSGFLCSGLLAVFAIGMVCVLLQRWDDAHWVASRILRLGLLATVIGLIMAFSVAGNGIANADPEAMKGLIQGVIQGMFVALFATFIGLSGNLWIHLNVRLLGGDR